MLCSRQRSPGDLERKPIRDQCGGARVVDEVGEVLIEQKRVRLGSDPANLEHRVPRGHKRSAVAHGKQDAIAAPHADVSQHVTRPIGDLPELGVTHGAIGCDQAGRVAFSDWAWRSTKKLQTLKVSGTSTTVASGIR